ncbi:MAG: hypothetical protein NZ455_14350 [Bacteroidia bacterium]|nr:hypothetical protein [Bacteroidia bacterium]MDW8348329.1 hypothetical protein [Bacteroidia bacterium]
MKLSGYKWLSVILVALSVIAHSCHQKPCPGVGGPVPKQSKKVQKAFRKYPVKTQ